MFTSTFFLYEKFYSNRITLLKSNQLYQTDKTSDLVINLTITESDQLSI